MIPSDKERFQKVRKAFEAWLTARGAELLAPTNEWEVLRFRHGDETAIVYTNKRGTLRWMGSSGSIFKAYATNSAWRAMPATKRRGRSDPTCQALRERDGETCFYCHLLVDPEDESVEHLVSITHGGPDHIANMALAHRWCNKQAGHASLMEKIRIRETNWRRLNTPGTVANLAMPVEVVAGDFEQVLAMVEDMERQGLAIDLPQVRIMTPEQAASEEVNRFDTDKFYLRLQHVHDNPDHTTIPPWNDK